MAEDQTVVTEVATEEEGGATASPSPVPPSDAAESNQTILARVEAGRRRHEARKAAREAAASGSVEVMQTSSVLPAVLPEVADAMQELVTALNALSNQIPKGDDSHLTDDQVEDLMDQAFIKILDALEAQKTGRVSHGETIARICQIERTVNFLLRTDKPLSFDFVMRRIESMASRHGDYAGTPEPIRRIKLVLHPKYPFRSLHGAHFRPPAEGEKYGELMLPGTLAEPVTTPRTREFINSWYSMRKRQTVTMYRHLSDGKIGYFTEGYSPHRRLDFIMDTVTASHVWTPEAELKACEKLKSHINENQFATYMLTGIFFEESKLSKNGYIFRKLRPTIVLGLNDDHKHYIKCALCLHPLGYYQSTFAGCMVPTDDVVTHYLMMKADEHHFWKKSTHHSIYANEAGI